MPTTIDPTTTSSASAAAPEADTGVTATIVARGVTKRYGSTCALTGVDLHVERGEILGLVGHNGAGKSTLMRILAGREQPDSGAVTARDAAAGQPWDTRSAAAADVRMVYQELALCADLTVAENGYLSDPRRAAPFGWRARAERRIGEVLDAVFPGHGIVVVRRIGDLTLAQRQMVEIARALCTERLGLLILDEPTESLGVDAADQLYAHLHRLTADGTSVLLVSHRMAEVTAHSDRVAVMRDGAVAGVFAGADEATLLHAMGGEVHAAAEAEAAAVARQTGQVVAEIRGDGVPFAVRSGEIVGLAGLAGQGQEGVLARLWSAGALTRGVRAPQRRAYVPGDRQTSGILPLWNVAQNLTIAALRGVSTAGIVDARAKRDLAARWIDALRIRGAAGTPITALSGGNQQKVLVARAFATDAALVLLDDPFRGVDVATKNELYTLMKTEAAAGRAIVWYSTENAEMAHCDRVYVLRGGRIVSELAGDTNTEERIIADSFDEGTAR
ncbi:sugar ABC transporter ATP-binding protein [Leifsonia naganoensis]|uniref:Ribose transport system ATP-binding protein n=1 Tax=Leifsonia naganoensis TaxID=150025 RepID=A0A853DVG6_9MICO|nr:sugar ABC transporter ATP-binding protein [Leifsonia naganoensis]NYK10190.1 ribose transport system ATP-binding protein [Leifsonia naganoensis]